MIKIKLPENVKYILHTLNDNGYEAYVVGGACRDAMLGEEPHDWDIATSAKPNEVMEVFKNFDIIPTGLKHGTVTINIDDIFMAEVTTFRVDGEYSDGRRPDNVEFTANIIEDLKRRDFTINAMAYNDRIGLIDPFHGRRDIRNKVVRCVGNPYDRFNEDALRILRAIRFAAQLEFYIDDETSNAIYGCMHMIDKISRERIQSELCKILSSNYCGCRQLSEYSDVINEFIPGFHLPFKKRILMNRFVNGYIDSNNIIDDIITRLALLFNNAENAEHILTKLKFSKNVIVKTSQLVNCYNNIEYESLTDKSYIKYLMNKLNDEQFIRLLTIKWKCAVITNKHPEYEDCVLKAYDIYSKIIANNECYTLKQLAVNGYDLINIGVNESKEIGIALDMLLDLVIHDSVENDKDALLKVIKEGL